MLSKSRLENLSDAVFAIVMTLLVIDIHLPEGEYHSNQELLTAFFNLAPVYAGYVVSFIVLATLWLGHNILYSFFAKTINRQMVQLNMLYLALVALIPFYSFILGRYFEFEVAVFIYGAHILLIGIVHIFIIRYALRSNEVETDHVPARVKKQAMIRTTVTPFFAAIGMAVSFVSVPFALVLYTFPIIFNIIPGTLDLTERVLGLNLG